MIEILSYEKMDKGSVKGKVSIKIPKWGNFVINEISLLEKGNNRWISFPSKKLGETWVPLMEFASSDMKKEFEKKIFELVDEI